MRARAELEGPVVGQTISHYKILEKLGEGGMGEVFLAQDTSLERKVALKFLPDFMQQDPTARKRFLREAKSAAALDHPFICKIYEVGEAGGKDFIAMEYVQGTTLKDKLADSPLTLKDALEKSTEVAEALEEAHTQGIVHRDLKPSNIMLTPQGHAKVMDFGLAKRLAPAEGVGSQEQTISASLTKTGATLGTLAYMSPEQLRGQEVDTRSDIFSFGVVLYEMLTGVHPFKKDSPMDTGNAILSQEPPPVTRYTDNVPELIQHIVRKMQAKDLDQRYQSIHEVRTDLREVLSQPTERRRDKPDLGRGKTGLWRALAMLAVFLIVWIGWWLFKGETTVLAPGQISSIAVLPLDNLMRDPEQDYFVDGMHEALITDLSKIGALKVISRTSVMRYKERDKSVPEIARELGVDAVVEGSVLRAGNRVRITAQLIHGTTDEHLWAESYNRDLSDILALQSEVARAIAREISIALTPEEETRLANVRTVDPKAHEAYLLGRHYWNNAVRELGIRKSIEYFEQAVELDPTYAPGYAGLAEAYVSLAAFNIVSPHDSWPQARAMAEKALQLDERLASAHTTLARVNGRYDWDWAGAEMEFKTALQLNPNSANARMRYALFLSYMERHDEASAQAERALELDPHPRSAIAKFFRMSYLYYSGHRTQAKQLAQDAINSEPDQPAYYWWLSVIYASQGRYEQALITVRKQIDLMGDDVSDELGLLGYLYAQLGQRSEAHKVLEQIQERSTQGTYVSPVARSKVYIGLGDKEQAFAWLNRGYETKASAMPFLKVVHFFDPLRDDPRFTDLLRRMGLSP
ncbi:protein kinase [Acidobacteria bacterium AH-259-O06]|nr:protein kinase [Acidobacteria bacterium AH-259-O06]